MLKKPAYTFENVKIYGNHKDIPLIYWFDLTKKEREQFDYIDDPEDNFTGFRYKGNVYELGEIMRIEKRGKVNDWMTNFDGYHGDSFFSGILVKFTDSDFIKVYTYIS